MMNLLFIFLLGSAWAVEHNKFLDEIYQIRPDHKKPGYSISTDNLASGYAKGSGPYDGWQVEFFLFRASNYDLVIEQTSGFEVKPAEKTFGFKLVPYVFKSKKMNKKNLKEIFPLKKIDHIFSAQTIALKKKPEFKDWKFSRLLRLPVEGTDILLKLCRDEEDQPFLTKTKCVTTGQLKWNQNKFSIKVMKINSPSDETI